MTTKNSLDVCPSCGGEADNGHDRCVPPSPYNCKKCSTMNDVKELERRVKAMKGHTDMIPWYWLSYGDKCYAFAVVEACQMNESDPLPAPGTELRFNDEGEWAGENDTVMFIYHHVTSIEEQNGGTICRFIAAAHANLVMDSSLLSLQRDNERLEKENKILKANMSKSQIKRLTTLKAIQGEPDESN